MDRRGAIITDLSYLKGVNVRGLLSPAMQKASQTTTMESSPPQIQMPSPMDVQRRYLPPGETLPPRRIEFDELKTIEPQEQHIYQNEPTELRRSDSPSHQCIEMEKTERERERTVDTDQETTTTTTSTSTTPTETTTPPETTPTGQYQVLWEEKKGDVEPTEEEKQWQEWQAWHQQEVEKWLELQRWQQEQQQLQRPHQQDLQNPHSQMQTETRMQLRTQIQTQTAQTQTQRRMQTVAKGKAKAPNTTQKR